jgi:hypothetical protein
MIDGCQLRVMFNNPDIFFSYTSVAAGGCGRFFCITVRPKKKDHDVNSD